MVTSISTISTDITTPTCGGKDGQCKLGNYWVANRRNRNFGILVGFVVFFMVIYIAAAEYLSLHPSKGEILVFRRGHSHKSPKSYASDDEESGPVAPVRIEGRTAEERPGSDTEAGVHSDEKEKSDSIFHWSNVCYDISIKGERRRILDHVDGWVKPGTLTALMVSARDGCR